MLTNKTVLAICCALLIGIGACSRQQSDWQKTREANTTEAFEQFLKKYPSGEFTAQAQARLKEMYEERDWQKARDADTAEAYQAFLKQYPEGKWTEEARIRVENFTLAQTPGASGPASGTGAPTGASPPDAPVPGASVPSGTPPGADVSSDVESEAPLPNNSPSARSPRHPVHETAVESGKYAVQLGAYKSGHAAADQRWERLRKEYPALLAGLSSKVSAKQTGGGTLYRLQAVGLSEAHARKVCQVLRAKSQPCVIVRPMHG